MFGGNRMKDTYIRIRMSELDKRNLKEQADKRQMSMSEYILYLIRRDADKEK